MTSRAILNGWPLAPGMPVGGSSFQAWIAPPQPPRVELAGLISPLDEAPLLTPIGGQQVVGVA